MAIKWGKQNWNGDWNGGREIAFIPVLRHEVLHLDCKLQGAAWGGHKSSQEIDQVGHLS